MFESGMAMWKSVILVALSVVATGTSRIAADDLSYYSPYKILTDHPGCEGPEMIALHVKFDLETTARYFYEGTPVETALDEECSVTSRKGTNVDTAIIPCTDGMAPTPPSDENMIALERISVLPKTVKVAGEIIQCLMPEEEFAGGSSRDQMTVAGSWTAQFPQPTDSQIEGGTFDRRWPTANFERSRTELLFDGQTFVTLPPRLRVFIGTAKVVDKTNQIQGAGLRMRFDLHLVPLFDVDCDIGGDNC